MKYLSVIFIAFAAICNAIMDKLAWHFPRSIFKDLAPEWWNPNFSWMSVKPFLGIVRLDAWHLAKFGMLGFICLAVMFYQPILKKYRWAELLIFSFTWSAFFELFFARLL